MKLISRLLRPEFFSNENIAKLDPLVRLFFQGLWCVADREGRIEDRGARLKALILPYDNLDPELVLRCLDAAGHIARYEVEGVKALQITSWNKYGKPWTHEKPSTLPQGCANLAPRLYIYNTDTDTDTDTRKNDLFENSNSSKVSDEIQVVFDAYLVSWGKNSKTYKLTADRRKWIAAAIEVYGKDGALRGVKKFRADPFEDRAKFNDIEYLFGGTEKNRSKRLDRWCGGNEKPELPPNASLEEIKKYRGFV